MYFYAYMLPSFSAFNDSTSGLLRLLMTVLSQLLKYLFQVIKLIEKY